MLTRAAVAKRLGKSIATVRRLEGSELNPIRDSRGVVRFAEVEVAALAARMAKGVVVAARGDWLSTHGRGHRPGSVERTQPSQAASKGRELEDLAAELDE